MGLRKDFLIHKQRTIESFMLARADISGINVNIDHIRNSLASIELKLSSFDNEILSVKKIVDDCISDISMQRSGTLAIQSKIDEIGNSINGTVSTVGSIRERLNGIFSQNQKISKSISEHKSLINNLTSKISSQSASNRKLNTKLKNFDLEIKKVKKLVGRKIKTTRTADLKLERKIRSQGNS